MNAHLHYTIDGELHEVELRTVDTFIGRSPDCEIQFLHDAELSRVHCSIQRQNDGSYTLVDEGSRNGTFLNEERVLNEEKPLSDGDRIRIGHTVMVFREAANEGRTSVLFNQVEQQMEQGEGYHTILGKIVEQQKKHKGGK